MMKRFVRWERQWKCCGRVLYAFCGREACAGADDAKLKFTIYSLADWKTSKFPLGDRPLVEIHHFSCLFFPSAVHQAMSVGRSGAQRMHQRGHSPSETLAEGRNTGNSGRQLALRCASLCASSQSKTGNRNYALSTQSRGGEREGQGLPLLVFPISSTKPTSTNFTVSGTKTYRHSFSLRFQFPVFAVTRKNLYCSRLHLPSGWLFSTTWSHSQILIFQSYLVQGNEKGLRTEASSCLNFKVRPDDFVEEFSMRISMLHDNGNWRIHIEAWCVYRLPKIIEMRSKCLAGGEGFLIREKLAVDALKLQ